MGVTHLSSINIAGVPSLGMSGIPATSGNAYFVNSVTGNDLTNPGTSDLPLATLAAAYAKCVSWHGDAIVLAQGHVETLSTAGAITLNKSGIDIIGLGDGDERPTFTWSNTAATWLITASTNYITNIKCKPSVNAVVSAFVVSAAYCTLELEWEDYDASTCAERVVLTTAAADDLKISLTHSSFVTGTCVAPIQLVGVNNAQIYVDFYGLVSTAIVNFITTASTNVVIQGRFYVEGYRDYTRLVVDTIGGSKWSVEGFDMTAGETVHGGSGRKPSDNLAEQWSVGTSKILADSTVAFTIAGGPIEVIDLFCLCTTGGDAAASTVCWHAIATGPLTSVPLCAASGSVSAAVAGATVSWLGAPASVAAVYNQYGNGFFAGTGSLGRGTALVVPGTITMVIGTADTTTGLWKHYMRWKPLAPGVTVTAS